RGDIADFLGLTIETVSRTISRLKQLGVVSVPSAHAIKIRDMEELEQLAEGGK
ncbi:MAG: Crp/Fnr family transcriptional regulator, partial [Alphaproteobacteria bacterium]